MCKRKTKKNGKFGKIILHQPIAIQDYNQCKGGVDRSDQMLSCHHVSLKCYRWWNTLFFYLTDIAVVNGFLLFHKYRQEHSKEEALKRPGSYSIVKFRKESIRQTYGWPEYDDPPAYESSAPGKSQFQANRVAVSSKELIRRNVLFVIRKVVGRRGL